MILSQCMALSLLAWPGRHPALLPHLDGATRPVGTAATDLGRQVGKLFSKSTAVGDRAIRAGVPARLINTFKAGAKPGLPTESLNQPRDSGSSKQAPGRPIGGDNRQPNIPLEGVSRALIGLKAARTPEGRRYWDRAPHQTGAAAIPRALEATGLPHLAAIPGLTPLVPDSSAAPDRAGPAMVSGFLQFADIAGRSNRSAHTVPALPRAVGDRDRAPASIPSRQRPSPSKVSDADITGRQSGFMALPGGSIPAIMQPSRMIPMLNRAALAVGRAGTTMDLHSRVVPPPNLPARATSPSAVAADRQRLARSSEHDPGQEAPDGQGASPGMPLVVHLTGDVMLDGRRLGQLTASSQARQASLPSHGTSRVDLRAVPIYSGAQVPR